MGSEMCIRDRSYSDDGGPDGLYNDQIEVSDAGRDYSEGVPVPDEPFLYTFCPSSSMDERVRLNFTAFDVAPGDYFAVYEGVCADYLTAGHTPIEVRGFSVGSMTFWNAGVQVTPTDATVDNLHFGSGWAQAQCGSCLLYTSPSPRDLSTSRMPSSA